MVFHYFTVPKTGVQRHIQPPSRRTPKVILSKEAQAKLGDIRHEKSECFQTTLNDAWHKLGKLTQTLTSNHQKSKANPWNAFCWKKGNQSSLTVPSQASSVCVQDADEENVRDATAEKESLVKEYNKYLVDKKVGIQMTTQGKLSDVTQTLKAVKEELLNLKSRTGVETLLYAMCGSTDLPLCAITFETEGVKDFMGTMIGVDIVVFISKMDGFAVQGVQGTASNLPTTCFTCLRHYSQADQRETP
ncbi:hypothetical protein HD554DRAFT_2174148 [Boletus coccyginus]|nr:hypothetical protein HD554DRAFT_2174148 [Boletus coccyginus]